MTKICGLKLTHDAAVAGIEDGKLIFCVEIEKLNNNPRYSKMRDMFDVGMILNHFNFKPDVFAVDGWKHQVANCPAGSLDVAGYTEFDAESKHLLDPIEFTGEVNEIELESYISFPHMGSHVLGSYATSPFAKKRECCYIISWDGGQNPRVHYFDPGLQHPEFVTSLFELYGIIYAIMGYYYGPYKMPEVWGAEITAKSHLGPGYDVPGKLMSFIGNGVVNPYLLDRMMGIYHRVSDPATHSKNPLGYNQDAIMEHEFMRGVMKEVSLNYSFMSDADVLLTIHTWLEIMLVDNAKAAIPKGANLIFTGGSALNIKWNSALRESGHFADVYVPPFPNDSGSAIGVAVCAMMHLDNIVELDWSVYCGMEPVVGEIADNWTTQTCSLGDLANFLAQNPASPVVFLNGRTEVGPRALGNRSILCGATEAGNKELLNAIKRRECFRPVAPICMEEFAPDIFYPGTPDPFMLFDHLIRPNWTTAIPAVLHIDGTARLQTVNAKQNEDIYTLLALYYSLTGIPVLCNTSANLNGSGFFPDVESAMRWPNSDFIWHDYILYSRVKP
jgi:carbamoyltransferase